ncbi:MAG: substrate-binding domain-containing protein [Pseudomonadota bacterium]|nr:substrate-binding domain-containing protein [Pseudomonadota bacterium]
MSRLLSAALAAALALPCAATVSAADRFVLVQSTTSTANSGLYDAILPKFEAATGIEARVVAVGTGQALKNARNCDGDVLVVHARAAEEAFVAEGHGLARHALMHNDFVIVGPADDPAGVAPAPHAPASDAAAALRAIAAAKAPFASRGDESGTHVKERALWAAAGVDAAAASGTWYRETGSGMGATLNLAVGMGAYALTDRATWAAFGNKAAHRIVAEGDPALHNPYGVIRVNPERCPNVRAAEAEAFEAWLLSPAGQEAIAAYRRDGQQLFFPDATD